LLLLFEIAEFDILYGQGISREGTILDLGEANDVITRSGTWYSYGETKMGQGRENARNFLKENPDIAREIEDKVREACGLTPSKAPVESKAKKT